MWGTLRESRPVRESSRFIPTHVGNAVNQYCQNIRLPVHPHACGERQVASDSGGSPIGSSPRMWGTPTEPVGVLGRPQVHPHACGERCRNMISGMFCFGSSPRMWGTLGHRRVPDIFHQVHPHACGERDLRMIGMSVDLGSSPRMWGTPSPVPSQPKIGRFIPTHVGNAVPCCGVFDTPAVHPHACGERKKLSRKGGNLVGSSPRMWGTRPQDDWYVC